MKNPILIEVDEWEFLDCIIQKQEPHPNLCGRYEIFKKEKPHGHIGRSYNFKDAIKVVKEINHNYITIITKSKPL